jgi:hypothetical protein
VTRKCHRCSAASSAVPSMTDAALFQTTWRLARHAVSARTPTMPSRCRAGVGHLKTESDGEVCGVRIVRRQTTQRRCGTEVRRLMLLDLGARRTCCTPFLRSLPDLSPAWRCYRCRVTRAKVTLVSPRASTASLLHDRSAVRLISSWCAVDRSTGLQCVTITNVHGRDIERA